MDFTCEKNRVYATNGSGEVVAEVTFPEREPGVVVINHTHVDPLLRGGGVAGQLLQHAYDKIKADGKRARATCSFAVRWFEKNRDKRDILTE